MSDSSSLVRESPLLLPQNKEKTVYDGFITLQGADFRLRVLLPPNRQLKHAKLQCCWRLKQLLRGYQNIIKQRLQHSSDLCTFILELKTVLEVVVKKSPDSRTVPPPQYYTGLIAELESLGWDKVLFINTELSVLRLGAEDSSSRQHAITVRLGPKYPAEAPECSADLPLPLVVDWTPQSTLASVYSQFVALLESLEKFWAMMDEIDEKTWILEPEKPTRGDTMRRIVIGNNVSIKLEVDPRYPNMLPECCLLGAEHVVTPLRSRLNANMHLWNPECSVLQNVKEILEIEFPSPATHEKSSFSMECGICYSYRLESAIPDQVCNDPRCGQPFHQECLYEWLRGLPTSRQSFSMVFGECPYCSKPITVKMAVPKP
ncbi:E3 ubiquitin-protein ligase FANCL [Brienomyrus brachyistius]|uniref:E3 ubiquitin-protein ligase FANCL n=1 Tax=Brienomyrus brachyistius TaxID=42636 RepID=UPI0020B42F60|nr:E3 ubiquitin-protein ligase FANCL [Brienomyrus brachyistius]XP_048864117.1 E3 ubiquitin-protein ligase FANCL [Brienomyrus brachyistius]XP_048864118.1 E3 ubiquitin-protein ligase FANCL [Brienomyrus brachyistius]